MHIHKIVYIKTFKIFNVQQAKLNNNYKNTKLKLLKWSDFKCFNINNFMYVH